MRVVAPVPATERELTDFHDSTFIKSLRLANDQKSAKTLSEADLEDHGLLEDCPLFPDVYTYVAEIGGGSLTAARELIARRCKTAIHFAGGRHHCKSDEASGYCYVNDIAMALLELQPHFGKLLYIDCDIHHGDGVEQAFYDTSDVLCLSLHRYEPGFFPGTGGIDCVGVGRGKYCTVNVPLRSGIDDQTYVPLFREITSAIVAHYKPNAIVFQCGCDGIAGDPLGGFNLTPYALADCVAHAKSFGLPMLLLGGGGYKPPNAARTWTRVTAKLLEKTDPVVDIPEHPHFDRYKPGFSLKVPPTHMSNKNTTEYLAELKAKILKNISRISQPVEKDESEKEEEEDDSEGSSSDDDDGPEEV